MRSPAQRWRIISYVQGFLRPMTTRCVPDTLSRIVCDDFACIDWRFFNEHRRLQISRNKVRSCSCEQIGVIHSGNFCSHGTRRGDSDS